MNLKTLKLEGEEGRGRWQVSAWPGDSSGVVWVAVSEVPV